MIRCKNCFHAEKFHVRAVSGVFVSTVSQPCDFEEDPNKDEQCGCGHFVPMRGLSDVLQRVEDAAEIVRRERMEREYGPIKTWLCGGRGNNKVEAYFDRYLDYDIPNWARGFGANAAEAVAALLENAEEHYAEQLDSARIGQLQRQSGCCDY